MLYSLMQNKLCLYKNNVRSSYNIFHLPTCPVLNNALFDGNLNVNFIKEIKFFKSHQIIFLQLIKTNCVFVLS